MTVPRPATHAVRQVRPGLWARARRAVTSPGSAWRFLRDHVRTRWFFVTCRLRGVRVEGGAGLRIQGRLKVRGPGRLVLGRNVRIGDTVTPWTYHPDAVISIGDNTFLNGTRFGCAQAITIGRDCILADTRVMDTDFHSLRADRHDPAAPIRVEAVAIGDNVFVGGNTGVLPGTTIGNNSVVGFGAVCAGDYPGDMIILGNPARAERPIPG